jgi:hypothetical protein
MERLVDPTGGLRRRCRSTGAPGSDGSGGSRRPADGGGRGGRRERHIASSWSAWAYSTRRDRARGRRPESNGRGAGDGRPGTRGLHAADGSGRDPKASRRGPQMPEQVLEECAYVEAAEIVRLTPGIERQAAPPGRDGQTAADREPIMAIAVTHPRGLPSGCPGPAHVGDEQESALIDGTRDGRHVERRFFFRGQASRVTGRWRPRVARRRGAPASDGSTPG